MTRQRTDITDSSAHFVTGRTPPRRVVNGAFFVWLALALMVVATAPAGAVTTPPPTPSGTPEAYGVTITKIEVSQDEGATYLTRFAGQCDVNLVTEAAGRVVAGLTSGDPLPAGTYNRLRITLGPTLYLKGYLNYNGATFSTNGGADDHGYEANLAGLNAPGDSYAVSAFTIPEASRTFEQAITLSISAASAPPLVTFDLSGTITQTSGNPTVNAPVVTVTVA